VRFSPRRPHGVPAHPGTVSPTPSAFKPVVGRWPGGTAPEPPIVVCPQALALLLVAPIPFRPPWGWGETPATAGPGRPTGSPNKYGPRGAAGFYARPGRQFTLLTLQRQILQMFHWRRAVPARVGGDELGRVATRKRGCCFVKLTLIVGCSGEAKVTQAGESGAGKLHQAASSRDAPASAKQGWALIS